MRAVLLVLLAAALFGVSTPAGKVLLETIHPVQLAGWLYVGAAIGVLPSLRGGGWTPPPRGDRRNHRRLAGAVLFGGVLGPIALLLGLRLASAASVSLWLNLELVFTALLGVLIFREHLGRYGWTAVAGVVASGALLSIGEGQGGLAAALAVALACLFWGLDNHLTALIDGASPAFTTFVKGVVAGGFNLILAAFLGAGWPGIAWAGSAIGVGAFAYGLSIALYITAAQGMGATRAQLVFAAAPFFGAGASWLVLREPLTPAHAGAGLLLIVSLALLFRDQHGHVHTHEALEHTHSHRHDDRHHDHEHPGLAPGTRHSHRHRHDTVTHVHPHWPDIHHRHAHGAEAAEPPERD